MIAEEVREITVQGQQAQEDGTLFPLVMSPYPGVFRTKEDALTWVRHNRPMIKERMLKSGVVVFRGFPLGDAQDFLDFINAFEWEFGTYMGGGGPRNEVLGPVHTSTESPPDVPIQFHHELAYLPESPSALFFFCEIPPKERGETPILFSPRVYKKLMEVNEPFVKKIIEKKIRYTRVISDHATCNRIVQRSWQEIFGTQDRAVAEERARATGTDTVEWLADGSMKVVSVPLDGIRRDPRTGHNVFFNSIVLLHSASHEVKGGSALWAPTYGDFSPIEDADVVSAWNIMKSEGVEIKWEKGDVFLVDNTLALHSRNTFTPPRRILTAIIKTIV